jgi:hypothetical protein
VVDEQGNIPDLIGLDAVGASRAMPHKARRKSTKFVLAPSVTVQNNLLTVKAVSSGRL